MSRDPHKILGIQPGASQAEIRKAYIEKAKKYHPDAGGDSWAFSEVQRAYEALTGKKPGSKPKRQSSSSGDRTNQRSSAQQSTSSATEQAADEHKGTSEAFPNRDGTDSAQKKPDQNNPDFSFAPKRPSSSRPKRSSLHLLCHLVASVVGAGMAIGLGYYLLVNYTFRFRVDRAVSQLEQTSKPSVPGSTGPNDSIPSRAAPRVQQKPVDAPDSGSDARSRQQNPPSQRPRSIPNANEMPSNSKVPRTNPADPRRSSISGSDQQPAQANRLGEGESVPSLPDAPPSSQQRQPPASESETPEDPPEIEPLLPADSELSPRMQRYYEVIAEFERRLEEKQEGLTSVQEREKFLEALKWMQTAFKPFTAQVVFPIEDVTKTSDISSIRGIYSLTLGPPQVGDHPPVFSYPTAAFLELRHAEAVRIDSSYFVEVRGEVTYEWINYGSKNFFRPREYVMFHVNPTQAFDKNKTFIFGDGIQWNGNIVMAVPKPKYIVYLNSNNFRLRKVR